MGLSESKCRYCGSIDHASEDCPHGILESKCRYCGSTEHSSENCPHGIFESKCRYCGSTDHSSENCPHGILESKCRYCGSTNHASEDCPHGIFESKCRYCGSTNHSSEDCPHGLLGSSSSSRTTTTTQTSSSSSDESGCATIIAWLVGIGIVVFVVVWLAINVVLPVALLNSALALTVLAFVFKKYKTLFASLALIGGGYMLLDITNGWLSVNFVEKVVKNPDWISAFVYINAAALGLCAWLLIQPIWLKTEQKESTEKRKNLLLKGALILLVAIATAVAPVIYHSVQNPFNNPTSNNNQIFEKDITNTTSQGQINKFIGIWSIDNYPIVEIIVIENKIRIRECYGADAESGIEFFGYYENNEIIANGNAQDFYKYQLPKFKLLENGNLFYDCGAGPYELKKSNLNMPMISFKTPVNND